MIARINGKLIFKTIESVIIDAGGVGYEIFIPLSTYYKLPDLNEPLALNVYTNLREDAILLYGFLTMEEKETFQMLISVTGVGPKLARNIISGIAVNDLVNAISSGDKARLSSIPGIGGKSAERLILELKDKVKTFSNNSGAKQAVLPSKDPMTGDVISALDNLGYKTVQSEEAVKKAKERLKEGFSFEELFKESLKFLSKK